MVVFCVAQKQEATMLSVGFLVLLFTQDDLIIAKVE